MIFESPELFYSRNVVATRTRKKREHATHRSALFVYSHQQQLTNKKYKTKSGFFSFFRENKNTAD